MSLQNEVTIRYEVNTSFPPSVATIPLIEGLGPPIVALRANDPSTLILLAATTRLGQPPTATPTEGRVTVKVDPGPPFGRLVASQPQTGRRLKLHG